MKQIDARPAQANRVADYLEQHPDSTVKEIDAACDAVRSLWLHLLQRSTAKEIDAACDAGCMSKVLSDMPRMGYGIRKGWRNVTCAGGSSTREVRTYALAYRPSAHPDLFSST
jgi:hypothetical protein